MKELIGCVALQASCGWYIHGMCRGRTTRAWSTQDVHDIMFLPLHPTDVCPHQLGVFCLDMESWWIWVSEIRVVR